MLKGVGCRALVIEADLLVGVAWPHCYHGRLKHGKQHMQIWMFVTATALVENAAAMSTILRPASQMSWHMCHGRDEATNAVQETNKEAGVLVKAEERAKGRVDRRLYRTYLAAWGPFFAIPLIMVFLATSERGLQVSQGFSKRILIEMIF